MNKLVGFVLCAFTIALLTACAGDNAAQTADSRSDDIVASDMSGEDNAADPFTDPDAILGLSTGDVFEFDIDCGEFDYVCFFNDIHGSISDWVSSSYNQDGWYLETGGTLYSANGLCFVPDAEDISFSYILTGMDGSIPAYFSNSESLSHRDIYKSFTVRCGSENELLYFDDITMTFGEWLDAGIDTAGWFYYPEGDMILNCSRPYWAIFSDMLGVSLDTIAMDIGVIEATAVSPEVADPVYALYFVTDDGETTTGDGDGDPAGQEAAETDDGHTGEQDDAAPDGTDNDDPAMGGEGHGDDPARDDETYGDEEYPYDEDDDDEPDSVTESEDDEDRYWQWDEEAAAWEWIGPDHDPEEGSKAELSGIGWEWSEFLQTYIFYGVYPWAYKWYNVSYPRSLEINEGLVIADLDGYCDPADAADDGEAPFVEREEVRTFVLSTEYRIFRVKHDDGSLEAVTYEQLREDVMAAGPGDETLMKLFCEEEGKVFEILYGISEAQE